MPDSTIWEVRGNPDGTSGGDRGEFGGPVTNLTIEELGWKGDFFERHNGENRKIEITIDPSNSSMLIIELGDHKDTQVWRGQYILVNGMYRMSGILVNQAGHPPGTPFVIHANPYLP